MACSNDDCRDGQRACALADIERRLLADHRYRRRVRRALRRLPGPVTRANGRRGALAEWLALAACMVLLVLFVLLVVLGVPKGSRVLRSLTATAEQTLTARQRRS